MRVVVRVLTNEINHASTIPSCWNDQSTDGSQCQIIVSLFTNLLGIVDNISNEFEELVSFFPFFSFFSMVKF